MTALFTPIMDVGYRVLEPHAKPDEGGRLIIERARQILFQRFPTQGETVLQNLRRPRSLVLERIAPGHGGHAVTPDRYVFHPMAYQVVDRLPGRAKAPPMEPPPENYRDESTPRNGHSQSYGHANGALAALNAHDRAAMLRAAFETGQRQREEAERRTASSSRPGLPNQVAKDFLQLMKNPRLLDVLLEFEVTAPTVSRRIVLSGFEAIDRIRAGEWDIVRNGRSFTLRSKK